ncbi:MAG TPA: hypothetical protein VFE50_02685 [Cyclobacteriaceae bacterium]|nr:hypothetical protein [Cyclobacteriaceae bacterium]
MSRSLLIVGFTLIVQLCYAQRNIVISLDSAGIHSYPAAVFEDDVLKFTVRSKPRDKILKKLKDFSELSVDKLIQKINESNSFFQIKTPDPTEQQLKDNGVLPEDFRKNKNFVREEITSSQLPGILKQLRADLKSYHPLRLRVLHNRHVIKVIDLEAEGSVYVGQWTVKGLDRTRLDKIEFQVIQTSENALVVKYLKATKDLYVNPGLYTREMKADQFLRELEHDIRKIDSLDRFFVGNPKDNSPARAIQKRVVDRIQSNNILLQLLQANLEWMMAWSWYNDYKLAMNPFDVQEPDMAKLNELELEIAGLNKTLELLQKDCQLSNMCCCSADKLVPLGKETLIQSVISNTNLLNRKQASLDALQEKVKTYNSFLTSLTKGNTVFYDGLLYLSTIDTIHWMRHHNAALDYEVESRNAHPSMYCEIDEVHILVDNLKSDVNVSLQEDLKPYTPQSTFTQEILPVLETITSATNGLGNITNLFKSFKQRDSSSINIPIIQPIWFKDVPDRYKEIFKWTEANLVPVPDDVLNAKTTSALDTLLKTELAGPSKTKEAPVIVNYSLYTKVKDVKTDLIKDMSYKVYKRFRIQPFAALVYLPYDRTSSVYDEATQSFSEESLGRYDFVAGVKFFPWMTNIEKRKSDLKAYKCITNAKLRRRAHVLRGNQWPRNNLSFSAGVGTQQSPLKNWYFGVGLDLVKGFAITGGLNLFSRNHYNILNGVVISSSSSFATTTYVGFSVDPVVMATTLGIIKPK